jgi:acetyl-CoA synthetase
VVKFVIIKNMRKEGNLYFPTEEFKKKANVSDPKIYEEAQKDPVKFWEKLAKELFWFRKWKKAFRHSPPFFEWFSGGAINITTNIFEKNKLGWENIKKKPALIWIPEPVNEEPKIFTYEELFKKVCQFANALKKLGVKRGDRVGIYLPMIPEALISMLACARIGAVHVVVFSAFSAQALRVRLQITEAKYLITADGYWRRGKAINLKESADEAIKETQVEKIIIVKRLGNEIIWNPSRDCWWHEIIEEEPEFIEPEIMDAEDIFFILATSGSTGVPKACVHTCGGYTVQAYWTGKFIFDFHPEDIFWCTSDVGWITGHTYTVYSPLLNGVTTLVYEGVPDWPIPDRWAQIIEKNKVTIFYTAPTAIRMFEKYGEEALSVYEFKNLRLLGSVGEPIDEAAWLWYFKNVGKERCPIVDTWWQTETGGILITSLPGIGPFKPAHVGLPFPGIRAEILDDKGKVCEPGEKGNLVILPPFSPGFFRTIYKDPEKYLQTYWSKYGRRVYFTSDGAVRDENGLIRIIGRVDDAIKVAGHRITTGELEAAVNLHKEISESAVVGIPDEIKGEVPVVFAVYQGQRPVEEVQKEVVELIRKQIGPIALPKEVYLVNDLPKTRSGKIMRRILRRLFTGEDLGDLTTLANPESVEEIKKTIFKKKKI